MKNFVPHNSTQPQVRSVHKLSGEQVLMIEEALSSVGDFGEVRLVVEKGKLRFLVTQRSIDAIKWKQNKLAQE